MTVELDLNSVTALISENGSDGTLTMVLEGVEIESGDTYKITVPDMTASHFQCVSDQLAQVADKAVNDRPALGIEHNYIVTAT